MEIKPGIYTHYKGNRYEVLGVGKHSETLEDMVVYRALYASDEFSGGSLWIRPLHLFKGFVTVDGRKVPRFEKV
ncbi:MAG: DUF1653 domain-containing protein [Candidatus Paceibacterota bacterium]